MQFKHLKNIIYNENTSLKDVLESLGQWAEYTGNKGFGIIINNDGKCVGVITDGDVRRKMLEGFDLNDFVKNIMNKDFTYVNKDDNHHHILRQFDKNITILPVIDRDGKPIDLYQLITHLSSLVQASIKSISLVFAQSIPFTMNLLAIPSLLYSGKTAIVHTIAPAPVLE